MGYNVEVKDKYLISGKFISGCNILKFFVELRLNLIN